MKKGFTLLEVIIVLFIVTLLVTVFQDAFKMDKKEFINSNTCVNYAFGQMKTFLNSAITGRGYYTGNKYEYGDKYVMNFNQSQNKILLKFSGDTNTTIKNIVFSGGDGDLSKCYAPNYKTTFSGNLSKISVNKGLQGTISNDPFSIEDNNNNKSFTGSLSFYFKRNNGDKRILSKVIADKRVNQLRFSRCMQWQNDMSKCQKWSN